MNRNTLAHTVVKGIRLLAVAALLAGLAVALQPATPAYAATLTVTTSNDVVGADGQCNLREAINNANANADTTVPPSGSVSTQAAPTATISSPLPLRPMGYLLSWAGRRAKTPTPLATWTSWQQEAI